MHLLPTIFFLGLAGLDIAGMMIIISALSMNVPKKQIYIFTITSFVSTVLLGVFCSEITVQIISFLNKLYNYIPDKLYAIIGIFIGSLLLYWFIERVFIRQKHDEKANKKEGFFTKFIKKNLFLLGLLFALWAGSDPSFFAAVTISAHTNNLITMILALSLWMVIGQLPLYILVVATMFNKHQKAITYYNEKIKGNAKFAKVRKAFSYLLSILILLLSAYFILDSIFFFTTGKWLF